MKLLLNSISYMSGIKGKVHDILLVVFSSKVKFLIENLVLSLSAGTTNLVISIGDTLNSTQ